MTNAALQQLTEHKIDRLIKEEVPDRINRAKQGLAYSVLQKLIERTPVLTGFARASWTVELNAMPSIVVKAVDPTGGNTLQVGVLAILQSREGDTIWIVNTADYFAALEHGYSAQAPQGVLAITLVELEAIYG